MGVALEVSLALPHTPYGASAEIPLKENRGSTREWGRWGLSRQGL